MAAGHECVLVRGDSELERIIQKCCNRRRGRTADRGGEEKRLQSLLRDI